MDLWARCGKQLLGPVGTLQEAAPGTCGRAAGSSSLEAGPGQDPKRGQFVGIMLKEPRAVMKWEHRSLARSSRWAVPKALSGTHRPMGTWALRASEQGLRPLSPHDLRSPPAPYLDPSPEDSVVTWKYLSNPSITVLHVRKAGSLCCWLCTAQGHCPQGPRGHPSCSGEQAELARKVSQAHRVLKRQNRMIPAFFRESPEIYY